MPTQAADAAADRSTRPTISWPGMIGSFGSGSSPSTTCRSVRQTPHAATSTRTSPRPGLRIRRDPRARVASETHQPHGPHVLIPVATSASRAPRRRRNWTWRARGNQAIVRPRLDVAKRLSSSPKKDTDQRRDYAPEAPRARHQNASALYRISRHATSLGENPFACVICEDDRIIAETTTRAARDADITRHAEVLAISEAQKGLATSNLTRCTLYSTSSRARCARSGVPRNQHRPGGLLHTVPGHGWPVQMEYSRQLGHLGRTSGSIPPAALHCRWLAEH